MARQAEAWIVSSLALARNDGPSRIPAARCGRNLGGTAMSRNIGGSWLSIPGLRKKGAHPE